jgi:RNA polymerase sigma-70 factor (ECF subfamily)
MCVPPFTIHFGDELPLKSNAADSFQSCLPRFLFASSFVRRGFENGKEKPCPRIAAYPFLAAARPQQAPRAAAAHCSLFENPFNSNKEDMSMLFENPYTLRTESGEGIMHYFVSFTDGEGIHRETEVSRPVYREFERFVKVERNLRRSDERHIEQSELTDETLNRRASRPAKSAEETVFDMLRNERLRQVVAELPETQRRRFVLYHEFGFTYEQIADVEGCTKVAVKYAVDKAKAAIAKKLEDFFE